MKRFAFCSLALITLFLVESTAIASLVPLINPSFESPVIPIENQPYGQFTWVVEGWETAPGANQGTWHPLDLDFPAGPPDGNNVVFIGPGYIYQESSAVLTADYTYTLGVYVGNRGWSGNTFPEYEIQLLAGDNVLSSIETPLVPPVGTFDYQVLTYTAQVDDIFLGMPVGVSLVGNGNDAHFEQIIFDMVSLDASPVPVPRAVWLLGSGLLCFVGTHLALKKKV